MATVNKVNKEEKALAVKKEAVPAQQKMVDQEVENRKILTQFIAQHMVKGVDYGPIHINSKCENKYNCKLSFHFSKDCLFKPGAEKFTSLMKLKAQYKKDTDTWEMAGSQNGLFCYICELIDGKGTIVGEGRGAASISEKGNPNTAIKIAEKRAKMDAVLSTGGLSDFFTQDLEDMFEEKQVEPEDRKQTDQTPKPTVAAKLSYDQQKKIFATLNQKGRTKQDLDDYMERAFKKTSITDLTPLEASTTIEKLSKLPDKQVEDIEPEIDLDEVEAGIEEMKLERTK